jgi:predicted AlkP superfamily pyrophosphatase or phosphodiesterase
MKTVEKIDKKLRGTLYYLPFLKQLAENGEKVMGLVFSFCQCSPPFRK